MATDIAVLARMEEQGYQHLHSLDPEYWGVYEDFEAVKAEMEREQYEEIKIFIKHLGYAGDVLTQITAKLHADFLKQENDGIDAACWQADGPSMSYKDFHIYRYYNAWCFDCSRGFKFWRDNLLDGLLEADRSECK